MNVVATILATTLTVVPTPQYDNNLNRTKIIDPELRETNYVYDERNLLFTVTDARLAITQYDYDLNGNLKSVKDANTNTTQYFYDDFDRLKETHYADSSVESYTYDAVSNLKTKTNGAGEVIRYTYDELNRLKLKEYLKCAVNLCGGDVTYTYDAASRLTSASSVQGTAVSFQYDHLNRTTKETTTLSNGSEYTISSQYDKAGNRTDIAGNTEPLRYTYDSMNRLTQIARKYRVTLQGPAESAPSVIAMSGYVIARHGLNSVEAIYGPEIASPPEDGSAFGGGNKRRAFAMTKLSARPDDSLIFKS